MIGKEGFGSQRRLDLVFFCKNESIFKCTVIENKSIYDQSDIFQGYKRVWIK
jgi:hypothetical protein